MKRKARKFKFTESCSLALILAALLAVPHASAVSLTDYLEQVKQESTGYKASATQSEGAELKSREADLFFTPQLFANVRAGHDNKPNTPQMYDGFKSESYSLGLNQQFNFGLQAKLSYEVAKTDFQNPAPAITPSTYWDAAPKVELTMPLWANGFGRSSRATQDATRQQSLAEHYSSSSQAEGQLVGAEATYWKLSAWKDVVTIQEQALQAAQNILDYVSRKKSMNLGEESDVIQAKALVEARTLELQVAKNEAQEAQRAFNKYLNKSPDAPVGDLEKVNYQSLESITVPSLRPGERSDVKASEAQLAAAKASAVITRERNRPSLDLYGTYAMNGRDPLQEEAMREAGKSDQDTAFVGVRFTMPLNIMAAGDTKAGALKSQQAAELARDYALYSQEQDWVNLTRSLGNARDNLRLISKIETIQKTKLETERNRLKQGRTTTYQVLLFEQDYTSSAVSKVKMAANILAMQSQLKLYQNSPEGGR